MSLEGNDYESSSTPTKDQAAEPSTNASTANERPKETSQILDEVDIDAFLAEDHPYGMEDGEALTEGNKINHSAVDETENLDSQRDDTTSATVALSSQKNGGVKEYESTLVVVVDQEQKRIFEHQKEEIMRTVPKAVKKRFGEVVFATFGSYIGPVLILDPYRISPGPVRDQWLKMYHKVSHSKRICSRVTNCSHCIMSFGT
jgi:hypothetical protein